MGVYLSPNTSIFVYVNYLQLFVYQLYLNKAVFKKDKSRDIFFYKIAWVNMNNYEEVNRKTEVM